MVNVTTNRIPMERIYFDISDIVSYAQHHSRVSGIQRVQWNIMTYLSQRCGSEIIRCTYYDARTGMMCELSPEETFIGEEFNSELLLIQLGLLEHRRFLPSRPQLKGYLKTWSHNKPLRTLRKLEVYLAAFFWPKHLARLGLRRMPQLPRHIPPATRKPLSNLQPKESFVLLGPHWHAPQVLDFALRHKRSGGDVVQLVCDLIPHKFPDYTHTGISDVFTQWLIRSAESVTRFMCISECTARDLHEFLQQRPGKWQVAAIPLALEFLHFERFVPVPPPSERVAAVTQQPYVLCVGTIEVRKNGATLLRVWQQLKRELGAALPRLIFAGSRGWRVEEFTALLAADPDLAEVIEAPIDAELASLYQNCQFTVYPSHYEGWGLPVGESAWFGKYCVAANTSSLPEVCGNLIDYADPEDPADMAEKLRKALTQPQYVRTKELAIRAHRVRRWTEVAEDMLQFIARGARTNAPLPRQLSAVPTAAKR
jgi:glycosyltransferase involved in cell wall biosynthesis